MTHLPFPKTTPEPIAPPSGTNVDCKRTTPMAFGSDVVIFASKRALDVAAKPNKINFQRKDRMVIHRFL